MSRKFLLASCLAAAGLTASATPALAAVYVFSGTRENMNPGTVPGLGRCVPPYFSTSVITPGNFSSTGVSNFGAFTATMSHCNLGPPPSNYVDGLAQLDFNAGDSLFATYTGAMQLSATPGIFDVLQDWTITGGTGRFLNATGFVTHAGLLRVGMHEGVRVGIYAGSFEGKLDLPAVPEPASWALMILGFGLAGLRVRQLNRRTSHHGGRHVCA